MEDIIISNVCIIRWKLKLDHEMSVLVNLNVVP